MIILIVALVLLQQSPRAPEMPSTLNRSVVPQCAAATSDAYGHDRATPVQVGGGAMYGPSRERSYLDALRGPEGQPVRYRRTGSLPAPDGVTILDAYETTYDGLEKPITLYIDEYHFSDPVAPRGFTCGQPFAIGVPPVDPLAAAAAMLATAIEQGGSRDFSPIALDSDGATTHGVAFDHFRIVARASRAAVRSGVTLNPQSLPASITQPRTVVLAYPLSCGGRTAVPVGIDIVGVDGGAVRKDGDYARDAALGTLLPGVQAPVSSLAARFVVSSLRPGDTVHVTYGEGSCTGGEPRVLLPVRFSEARITETPMPSLPPGAGPGESRVRLQVIVDLDGMFQQPVFVGGPLPLSRPAMDAIRQWRSVAPHINGAPIARAAMVQVTFKE
jgi:hypothetical protein